MITTSEKVTIKKVLRYGVKTTLTTQNTSLFIYHGGEQKRFNATTVVNSTATSSGLITFVDVPLWGDGSYSMYITTENNNDIDVNGVVFDKIATGYLKKITNRNEMEI